MHRQLLVILSVVCVLALTGHPASAQSQGERSAAFDFLRLPPSASTAASAGAAIGDETSDVTELFYNPALLEASLDGRAALSYLNHVGDVRGGVLAYAHHLEGWGTIGGGLRYLGYGTLDRLDREGRKTGTFGANDLAVSAAFSYPYGPNLRLGGSGRLVTSAIAEYRTTAVAFDLGASYRWPAQRLTLQAAMTNGGRSVLQLGTVRQRLPLGLHVTASKRLEHVPVRFSVTGYELHEIRRDTSRSVAGNALDHLNLNVNLYLGSAVVARFGYSPRMHRALSSGGRLDLAGLTSGLTLRIDPIRFDYAYRSWSGFGGLHFLTIQSTLSDL